MIKVKYLNTNAKLYPKSYPTDIGYNLSTVSIDYMDNMAIIHTGVSVTPPKGYYFDMVPRSSFSKTGYVVGNSFGIIDPTYTGELIAKCWKVSDDATLEVGKSYFQLVFRKIHEDNSIIEVDKLDDTDRGSNGFGSTDSIKDPNKFKGRIYVAGGWFSDPQRLALDNIEKVLTELNLSSNAFMPRHHNSMNKLKGARTTEQRMECFRNDVAEIDKCDYMICSAVEYDSGTIFELGVAYAKGKPIIYYNDNPEDHKKIRNLMLVGACDNYYAKNANDLVYILTTGNPTSYGDDSENELGRL